MAQNIFEDLSRKPVARALRPAAAMTQLKLTFGVTHRSPIRRIWTNRQLATNYCTRIASDLSSYSTARLASRRLRSARISNWRRIVSGDRSDGTNLLVVDESG